MVGRTSRIAAIALVTGLAVTPILATASTTKTVQVVSHVSIHERGLTFSGRVTSPRAACRRGRRVTLHRTNGVVLGFTSTGSSGKWRIRAAGSAGISLGHFYASARASRRATAGTIYACKASRSKTIAFH